jgi:hypothetical protein|tara:strand:- start:674 stop:907 length:234 start_codon:yes stop_codon:yes gene_type:complete
MTIPTVDTRKVWLDETTMKVTKALMKFTEKELNGTPLSRAELNYSKLCTAYLYLLKLVEKHDLLDESDNPFQPETLH